MWGGVDSIPFPTPPPFNFVEWFEASSILHSGSWVYKETGSKMSASELKNSRFKSQMRTKFSELEIAISAKNHAKNTKRNYQHFLNGLKKILRVSRAP